MSNVRPFQRDTADHDGPNRTSPHDAEAEAYVAGIVMHDRVAYLECAEVLDRKDIYSPAIRLIWDVVGGMVAEGKQLHPVTVKAEIARLKRLHEVEGGNLVDRLGAETISAGMAASFAEQIAERAELRRWDEHANELKAKILSGATVDELDRLADKHREQEQRRHTAHGPTHLTGSFIDWDPFFATDFGNVELLLGGLMAPGQQITIVGDGKAGKSLFTQEWLWRMATGQSFLDDRARPPVPLLYVDAENGHQDVQGRLLSYGGGPGRMGLMTYASFPPVRPLDTAGGGADLLAMVAECEAQLVCLDTVSRFISGPENDADTWLALYRHTLLPLKRAGISSVRLDHLGKDSERGARGSSAKNQDVDHVWELRAQGGGTVVLKRTYTRTGIGPDSFVMLRQYRKDGDAYVPGATRHVLMTYDTPTERVEEGSVGWLVRKLDDLGLPNDAGNPRTKAALANAGIKIAKNKIEAAVRERKNRDNLGSPDRFPETFPEDVPREPSPGTPTGSENPQVKHSPGTSRERSPDPGSPTSPPPKVGEGEGTATPQATDDPLCTVCEHPLHGYRLDRGYTTHLACDPDTGSHPPQTHEPHDAA
ncbi:AAA family ATPase [Streptomyces sp. NBC_01016]|uniref:AAA family ATPase n=1 Tax=Streptomyces sp. NBC_01016 TaxID=2903720 RepID=UPI00224FBB9A|nr:AAA family ATPase [Streptomyces sp. NBC_01016]MCX4827143.1 AAA family ATPase [Streptomyces sp. NBC_01016]MCX4832368.1 AAA family ATPase [Streptomyces sp. NBC_01016]